MGKCIWYVVISLYIDLISASIIELIFPASLSPSIYILSAWAGTSLGRRMEEMGGRGRRIGSTTRTRQTALGHRMKGKGGWGTEG